ncbi:hypothetical protein SynMVIR181_01891 [Synechococcus sp. MVIR-18-1]|nr:hypothetical protein SynMVIR181_01891 [Synechococcus sp. MVIR-18-1]
MFQPMHVTRWLSQMLEPSTWTWTWTWSGSVEERVSDE